jgi:crotonobetainyl-CoA:carnitine CoA-transferase CaiB-like acyl-CoA transferase
VQSACGIADSAGAPGVLPAQALDHGTGYLMVAAALRALTLRTTEGHAAHARLALTRTARGLLGASRVDAAPVAG